MKIAVILNGASRKRAFFYSSILPELSTEDSVNVFETEYAGHARQLAAELPNEFEAVIAAGGDGTLHEVLNGMMSRANPIDLGVLPLGSGNDFANTCGIQPAASFMKNLLRQSARPTDIGKVVFHDEHGNVREEFFLNACSAGMGPATVSRMKTLPTWLSAQSRYLIAIIHTFFTHHPEEMGVTAENFQWRGKARVIAIANGKSFGSKIFIAPDAQVDDAHLNIFVGGNVPLLKFLTYLQSLKSKKKVRSAEIHYATGKEVHFASTHPTMLEADGELIGWLPARVTILANQIKMFR